MNCINNLEDNPVKSVFSHQVVSLKSGGVHSRDMTSPVNSCL